MNRFFVPPEQIRDGIVTITGGDVNHLKNVLRLKKGGEVLVNDGSDRVYRCAVDEYGRDEARLTVLSSETVDRELPSRVVLFQGLPKGDKFDAILQKSVELGVYSVVPVEMKRCVAKWDKTRESGKLKRYRAISESAAKQSGRNFVPEVAEAMTLEDAVAYANGLDVLLVPYENEESVAETNAALDALRPDQSVGVFIGPEGGFEPEEIEKLKAAGAKTVTLGKRILRTETAGPAVLAMLVYLLEIRSKKA